MTDPSTRSLIASDWRANASNPKARLLTLAFRLASHCRRPRQARASFWSFPVGAIYRVIVEWILGFELPWKTQVGPGLRVSHGQGLVVHDHTILGSDVLLRHGVTIGIAELHGDAPTIGSRVEFGAHSIVIGDIVIGDDCIIGAGAVVTKSMPPGHVAIGNPAHIRARNPSSPSGDT